MPTWMDSYHKVNLLHLPFSLHGSFMSCLCRGVSECLDPWRKRSRYPPQQLKSLKWCCEGSKQTHGFLKIRRKAFDDVTVIWVNYSLRGSRAPQPNHPNQPSTAGLPQPNRYPTSSSAKSLRSSPDFLEKLDLSASAPRQPDAPGAAVAPRSTGHSSTSFPDHPEAKAVNRPRLRNGAWLLGAFIKNPILQNWSTLPLHGYQQNVPAPPKGCTLKGISQENATGQFLVMFPSPAKFGGIMYPPSLHCSELTNVFLGYPITLCSN